MPFEVILGIILAGCLSSNYAMVHFLGTGAVIENERSVKRSLIIGAGTIITMVVATLITWPINKYLLTNAPYLKTMVFTVVIMAVVCVIHLFAKKNLEGYCKVDFLKFAINGAVLGVCLHNVELASYFEAILTAFATGLGVTFAMILFSTLHDRIDESSVPASFRGLPISLLTAGLIALTFCCLAF